MDGRAVHALVLHRAMIAEACEFRFLVAFPRNACQTRSGVASPVAAIRLGLPPHLAIDPAHL